MVGKHQAIRSQVSLASDHPQRSVPLNFVREDEEKEEEAGSQSQSVADGV